MATVILPFTAVDGNGNVRANARLYFYQTGTTTPQNTYADAALSAVNTNPVVADSNGLFPGIYLGDPPTFTAYKAILKTSADVTVWTQDPIAGAPVTPPISVGLLRGYLSGLQRTGSTGTTYSQGAGVAADDDNVTMLSLISGTINAATVGADGIDAGALTATATFHAFAIGKTDGTTARLLSASPTSPTMPSGYVYKRRTASLKTTVSSQIIPYLQFGDKFLLLTTVLDVFVTTPGVTAVTRTLPSVPTGITVEPILSVRLDSDFNGESHYFSSLFQTDQAVSAANSQVGIFAQAVSAVSVNGIVRDVFTNTSGQIRTKGSSGAAAASLRIQTNGWIDTRGRDD